MIRIFLTLPLLLGPLAGLASSFEYRPPTPEELIEIRSKIETEMIWVKGHWKGMTWVEGYWRQR